MKKLKVLGVAAATVGMVSLTSCLGDGNNTQSLYGYGVVDFNMTAMGNVVQDDYGNVVYSPAFAGLNIGDFVVYYGTIDYDEQTSDKYFNIEIAQNGFERLNKYYSTSQITDKDSILQGESAISEASFLQTYIGTTPFILRANKHAFIMTAFQSVPRDRKFNYELAYDSSFSPVTEGGKRVYDFYLRATVATPGSEVQANYTFANVFDVTSFLDYATEIERNAGQQTVNIRLNYINAFNKDSTGGTWTSATVASFPILAEPQPEG